MNSHNKARQVDTGDRVPVRYKDKILMPMSKRRVAVYMRTNRGNLVWDNQLGLHYLELVEEPVGYDTQAVVIGVDPGSTFDGFSVVSAKCHHVNIQLNQRSKFGKSSVKGHVARRALKRRERRSRLWHRSSRYDKRLAARYVPTTRANNEFRIWLIEKLIKIFPVSEVAIEDVSPRNYYNGDVKGNSKLIRASIGKIKIYDYITNVIGLPITLVKGYETKVQRTYLFGGEDLKLPQDQKGERSFFAHSIDSFAVSTMVLTGYEGDINQKTTFIGRNLINRRELFRNKKQQGNSKYKVRFLKGGIPSYFSPLSTSRIYLRSKVKGSMSNHGPWSYMRIPSQLKYNCTKESYGGCRRRSQASRRKHKRDVLKFEKFESNRISSHWSESI